MNQELESQLVIVTQGELNNWQNTILKQAQKINAYNYLMSKIGNVQNFKKELSSPEVSIRLKISPHDTWDTILDKVIKAQAKSVKTRK